MFCCSSVKLAPEIEEVTKKLKKCAHFIDQSMKTACVQVFFYVWLRTWIIFNTCYVLTAGFCIVEFSFTNFDAQDLLIAMIHFKVNNAGISGLGTIENTSLDLFDQIMRINVRYELEEKSLVNCLIIKDRLFSSIIGLLNFCYFDYIS